MQGSISSARFEEIEAFATVVEAGSFVAAAKTLGRDPSVLSRRVTALERRLGVRLLARTTRHLGVTEAGGDYLLRVQTILAELTDADADASRFAAVPRGALRLALPLAFGRRWIAPMLPGFLAAYPEIRIEAQYGDHFTDIVAERVDVAIRIGPQPASGLVTRHLASFSRVLCASPGYIARRGKPHTPHDLTAHACIGFAQHRFWPTLPLRRDGEIAHVTVSGPLVANDGEALAMAARDGVGILLGSDWLVGPELADGRLIEVLPGWTIGEADKIGAVMPPGRLMPAKSRVFVDWVTAAFLPRPPWSRETPTRP